MYCTEEEAPEEEAPEEAPEEGAPEEGAPNNEPSQVEAQEEEAPEEAPDSPSIPGLSSIQGAVSRGRSTRQLSLDLKNNSKNVIKENAIPAAHNFCFNPYMSHISLRWTYRTEKKGLVVLIELTAVY